MTRKKIKDKLLENGQLESESFLTRLRNTPVQPSDLELAREKYGYELAEDVIEVIARQQALARPVAAQFHLLHEQTPTLQLARATMQKDMDEIIDVFVAMDLSDLGDIGEFQDEYSCPKCAHRWSGAPNSRTGFGNAVYVPTGRISKHGNPSSIRYGAAPKTVRGFAKQRDWKAARPSKLPRGFGNRPIGEPVIGESWRKRSKPPAGYETQ